MSTKGFIVSLSLACSAGGLAGWLLIGETGGGTAAGETARANRSAPLRTPVRTGTLPNTSRPGKLAAASASASQGNAQSRQRPVAAPPLTAEELTARASRVEQEANHDLRRLVELLDLSEEQQEKVFQTLAQHSPSWSPEMQFAPATGTPGAATAGRRSESVTAPPGLYLAPPAAGEVTAPVKAPAPPGKDSAATPDPIDEIMALLSPEQQDTLLQEEIDRAAWWAEVLEQIDPTDDIPAINGSPPATGTGETKTYEGADVLE